MEFIQPLHLKNAFYGKHNANKSWNHTIIYFVLISLPNLPTGQESTRSSIIVEIETVAEVMEPACHALGHCVQATSVVEKMKSITKTAEDIVIKWTIQ
jgi:hypothetical protein